MSNKTHTRVVVHIGPQKTGTSHLARYLTLASGELEAHGILYPTADLWFDDTGRIVKHHALQSGPFASNGLLSESMTKLADVARAQAGKNASLTSTTIFVTEMASANLQNPRDLEDFLLENFDEVVFVFLARRQDHAMSSLIAHRVKDINNPGTSLKYADYSDSEKPFMASIDYAALLEKWALGAPRSRIVVIPYIENESDPMASVNRFLDVLGLTGPEALAPTLRKNKINPSFSELGLRELAKLKKPAGRFSLLGPSEARRREIFDELTKKHHDIAHGKSEQVPAPQFVPWSLPAKEKKQVLADFAESNQVFLDTVDRGDFAAIWATWLADD